MNRKFESGAVKRKKAKEREKLDNQQRNSLAKFIKPIENQAVVESENSQIPSDIIVNDNGPEISNDESNDENGKENRNSKPVYSVNLSDTSSNYKEKNKHIDESSEGRQTDQFSTDIAHWPAQSTEKMIAYYLINKPCSTGYITTLKMKYTDRNRTYYRSISESNFYCMKANGTKELRQWLLFSGTSKLV